jgi:hypothetical protein
MEHHDLGHVLMLILCYILIDQGFKVLLLSGR